MDRSISTGFSELDGAIGLGGIPATGLIELYGPDESSLKNLAFQILEAAQVQGEVVAFIDTTPMAKTDEYESDSIRVITASDLASIVQEGESLIREGVNLLVIGPLPDTNKEIKGSLSHAISRLREISTEYQAALLLINPWKITLHTELPEQILHPNPIAQMADVRIEIKSSIEVDTTEIQHIEALILKNRFAEPFGEAQFHLL